MESRIGLQSSKADMYILEPRRQHCRYT